MELRKIVKDQIKYRFDPLTGSETRINPQRDQWKDYMILGLLIPCPKWWRGN